MKIGDHREPRKNPYFHLQLIHMGLSIKGVPQKTGGLPSSNGNYWMVIVCTTMAMDKPIPCLVVKASATTIGQPGGSHMSQTLHDQFCGDIQLTGRFLSFNPLQDHSHTSW